MKPLLLFMLLWPFVLVPVSALAGEQAELPVDFGAQQQGAPAPGVGRYFTSPKALAFSPKPGSFAVTGAPLAADGDILVVSASGETIGGKDEQGAVYILRNQNGEWAQEKRLVAADGDVGDLFGNAVALSGDTLLVSAPYADIGSNKDQGAVYVYTRSGGTWPLQKKLSPGDGVAGQNFGFAVTLEGDTAVIGVPASRINGTPQGAAYVFTRQAGNWSQKQKLFASDGKSPEKFGSAVDIDGDQLIIGADYAILDGNSGQGAAYIFTRDGSGQWLERKKLFDPLGGNDDRFGHRVQIEGTTALVSAHTATQDGKVYRGEVYEFTGAGANWTAAGTLTAANLAAAANYGTSLALQGDTVLIGSAAGLTSVDGKGTVVVFTRTGGVWTEQQSITNYLSPELEFFGYAVAIAGDTAFAGAPFASPDMKEWAGAAYVMERLPIPWVASGPFAADDPAEGDGLGAAVDIFEGTAVVGAPRAAVGNNEEQGAAYIFQRSGDAWLQTKILTAFDGDEGDRFGSTVAIHGDRIIVGAPDDDVGLGEDDGSAYVFTRSGGVWSAGERIIAIDGTEEDKFGSAVDIEGGTAAIGAALAEDGGVAYIYVNSGAGWTFQRKLKPLDGAPLDSFGASLSLDGDSLIAGAPRATVDLNEDRGAAYVFVRSGSAWEEQDKLTANDDEIIELFGYRVDVQGNTAVVSAPLATVEDIDNRGALFVFARSGDEWTQTQKLYPPDTDFNSVLGLDIALHGTQLLAGARQTPPIMVARSAVQGVAQGRVYAFGFDGSEWLLQQLFVPADGQPADGFGDSVALFGSTAVVGAPIAIKAEGRFYSFERHKLAQTIDFPTPPAGLPGSTAPLQAVASSGLPVSYSSTTPAVCTVSGSTANLLALGQCKISASQPGNDNYEAAQTVMVTFDVTLNPPPANRLMMPLVLDN